QNILKVKTFKINYTYNYIDYKFGIRLTRRYDGGSSATGNEDTAMVVNNLGFGTSITFGCTYEGINTGDGAKFTIDGYSIAGIKQSSTDRFTFEDIKLWEQVALNKYSENSNEIEVVLVLRPKITLNNYTTYTQADGYVYERTYNGENQGLVILGARIDVVIGGDFEAIVQYSFDNGLNFVDEKPINVGSYQVKIIAKIISDNSQVTNVIFEEKVVYVVTPAQLAISLKTYNLNNPITKTYDGTNNLSSKIIADDIGFNGLFDRDKDNVYVDATRLRAQFEDVLVNTASNLYDITVLDIYLIDASNNLITNYTIASGQNVIFTNIGKINPKALTITGFIAKNKVYDGTNAVTADISGISYIGKLATDSTQVLDENLKFYLKDYTIGEDREVFIDWTNALVGADSTNYSITFDRTFIDVHPYEITYDLKDYGTFKVVDVDRLGLIPIGSRILARAFDKGTDDYRTIYTTIEPQIAQGEKLKSCLEIIMQVNSINIQLPEGLYVYIPKINKITKVIQVPEEKVSETLEYSQQTEYTIIKVAQGEALIGVIVHTTYLPLWAIILIVIGGIILVGILVIIFIIIRRRTKRKYSVYDRI
ncbi:MAG: hypothetical protein J6Q15_02880, partial [Clostridia bacterium]|nr:hypothetical protein [Clostridia bacterium]